MRPVSACRVCKRPTLKLLDLPKPSVTSTGEVVPLGRSLFFCGACGHLQSDGGLDSAKYYDVSYRLSLETEDHDQLLMTSGEEAEFRSVAQARIVLDCLEPTPNATLLDLGAAKGLTARHLVDMRQDLSVSLFDVSQDYLPHWSWLPEHRTATYELPDSWVGFFHCVLLFFVLEHVEDPVAVLTDARRMLSPGGSCLVVVPNPDTNPGDLLVFDHLNYFSNTSMQQLSDECDLEITDVWLDKIPGAVILRLSIPGGSSASVESSTSRAIPRYGVSEQDVVDFAAVLERLDHLEDAVEPPFAIYGAGFYGSLVSSRIGTPEVFVDMNPRLRGTELLGAKIVGPENFPKKIETLVVAINPEITNLNN